MLTRRTQAAFRLLICLNLLACLPGIVCAQQTGSGGASQGGGSTQSGGGGTDSGISLDRPQLTTDITQISEQQQTGFVGTTEQDDLFFGAAQAGQNANNQSNRNFNTRTANRNVNQRQVQPMYRTFGTNNVPYRSPHKIAFEVPEANGRVVDIRLSQHVRKLATRLPKFGDVVYEMTEPRTVVLKGFVPTERDKKLAMVYVKMEPGVDQVINQLQVGQPTPTPPAPQLPNANR
ncbi:MAG: BON domain-containing protein [Planctomycetaceae bacterium]|nr:BON domain-containing protein [Planctomycetaceae bacterium]